MLEDHGVGRVEVAVGHYSGSEPEELWFVERGRGGDEVGGEAVGQEIAGGAGGKDEEKDE